MKRNIGMPVILYGPEGDGGGGTGDGGGAGGGAGGGKPGADAGAGAGDNGGAGAPAPPWGDVNSEWKIGDKPWYETLVPEGPTRELMRAKAYKNPTVAADAYYNLNKLASSDAIVLPKEDAPQAEWDQYREKIGVPKTPDAYPEVKVPEGIEKDPAVETFGKNLAHKLGLTPKQFEGMVEEWNKFNVNGAKDLLKNTRETNDRAVAEMATKAGPAWDEQVTKGKNAVKALGLSDQEMDAIEAHIGAAPLLNLMFKLGAKTGEGGVVTSGATGQAATDPAQMSPERAAQRIKEVQANPDWMKAYQDKYDPAHADRLRELEALYAKAGNLV